MTDEPKNAYVMRWKCADPEPKNCFNKVFRPKFAVFAECFPEYDNFTDVDGIVLINASFLMLEWKSSRFIGPKQHRLFVALTKAADLTVFGVCGRAADMQVSAFCSYRSGKYQSWQSLDLEGLKLLISKWTETALGAP